MLHLFFGLCSWHQRLLQGPLRPTENTLSHPPTPSNTSSHCLRLTALLQYEHYDAYSESLGSSYLFDYQYPPAGYTLVDDEEFCANSSSSSSTAPQQLQLQQPVAALASLASLEYVSGAWLTSANSSSSLYDWRVQTQDDAFLTAWTWPERPLGSYHRLQLCQSLVPTPRDGTPSSPSSIPPTLIATPSITNPLAAPPL